VTIWNSAQPSFTSHCNAAIYRRVCRTRIPMYYLTAAANWAHAYITGPNNLTDTLNLYDVSGLAHFELYRAITLAGNPAGLAVSKTELLNDIKDQMTTSIAQADDPFGFGWPWSSYDTISHGAGLSVMAKEVFLPDEQRDLRDGLGALAGQHFWRERLGSDFHGGRW
jgi:hypothetical protein